MNVTGRPWERDSDCMALGRALATERGLLLGSLAAMLGTFLRFVKLDLLRGYCFDEAHYVPAALGLVRLKPVPNALAHTFFADSPDSNIWHPPLGKLLIGVGALALGDNPIGWRFTSCLAGSLSLWVFLAIALRVCRTPLGAAAATLLLAVDCLHLVQSRVAMLDSFAFLFQCCAVLTLLHAHDSGGRRRLAWLAAGSVALGLAFSVKHVAIMAVATWVAGLWCFPSFRRRERVGATLGACLAVPLVFVATSSVYFIHGYSFERWLGAVAYANGRGLSPLTHHAYGSHPAAWLFNTEPVWYLFEHVGTGIRGIVAQGNSVTWLALLPATHLLVVRLKERRRPQELFALVWLVLSYAPLFAMCWRREGFLYYMLPATAPITLCVAIGFENLRVPSAGKAIWWLVGAACAYTAAFAPLLYGTTISHSLYEVYTSFIRV
jgi:dolichyl-phosphate-mannose--protein O-mannosyl transferase